MTPMHASEVYRKFGAGTGDARHMFGETRVMGIGGNYGGTINSGATIATVIVRALKSA